MLLSLVAAALYVSQTDTGTTEVVTSDPAVSEAVTASSASSTGSSSSGALVFLIVAVLVDVLFTILALLLTQWLLDYSKPSPSQQQPADDLDEKDDAANVDVRRGAWGALSLVTPYITVCYSLSRV